MIFGALMILTVPIVQYMWEKPQLDINVMTGITNATVVPTPRHLNALCAGNYISLSKRINDDQNKAVTTERAVFFSGILERDGRDAIPQAERWFDEHPSESKEILKFCEKQYISLNK